jgi:uncharacterized protein YciI
MEFFCYHRDRPGSLPLREELLEEHWSYMGRYATEMIARGPTLADDGDTPTGSVHIVALPDPSAAHTSPSTSQTTRPARTGTCCYAGGGTCWGSPCGTSRAVRTAATSTW